MLDKNKWHDVYLGLGSNLGDKDLNLHLALNNINERIGDIIAISAFYVTDPVGFDSENSFLNAVCAVRTKLSPLEVLHTTQTIETQMGRKEKSVDKVYVDRIIDIDILLFDNEVIKYPHLILPHPHLHERSFVLFPLWEIAKDYIHPVLNKTIDQLRCELLSE